MSKFFWTHFLDKANCPHVSWGNFFVNIKIPNSIQQFSSWWKHSSVESSWNMFTYCNSTQILYIQQEQTHNKYSIISAAYYNEIHLKLLQYLDIITFLIIVMRILRNPGSQYFRNSLCFANILNNVTFSVQNFPSQDKTICFRAYGGLQTNNLFLQFLILSP